MGTLNSLFSQLVIVYYWLLTNDQFICDIADSRYLLTCHNQSDSNLLPVTIIDMMLHMLLLQISIPMSLEFDDLSIVRENPTEEMQSNVNRIHFVLLEHGMAPT